MLYKVLRRVAIILGRILYRFNVTGQEHVPPTGKIIICANHISGMDCLLLAAFCKRQIFFMGKKELFEKPILGKVLKKVGAFPVDRSVTDMHAYRHTIDLLKDDKALGIFCQGTRAQDFDNVKGGVAVFALKSGASIVPVGIKGTYRLFTKMHLRFGPPISMEPYASQRVKTELVEEVMSKVVRRVTVLSRCQ